MDKSQYEMGIKMVKTHLLTIAREVEHINNIMNKLERKNDDNDTT